MAASIERRARQLCALNAIATRVAAAKRVDAICRITVRRVSRDLGYVGAAIVLLPSEDGSGAVEAYAEDGPAGKAVVAAARSKGSAMRAALRTRRPRVVRCEGGAAALVPIIAGQRAWGVLGVAAAARADLDRRALQALSRLCRSVGIALEKHRLLGLAHRRIEDVRLLSDVSALVVGTLDLEVLLERVCRSLTRLVDVTQCFILLHDAASRSLYGVAATISGRRTDLSKLRLSLKTTRSLAVRAFRARRPIAVEDARRDPRVNARLVRMFHEKSLLAIPLLVRHEAIGVVMLGESRRLRRFEPDEIARAQAVANQAALALESALRHREAVGTRDRAELLLETVRECTSSVDLQETMRRIARRVVAVTSADRCLVVLPDVTRQRFRDIVHHGTAPRARAHLEGLRGRRFDEFPAGRKLLRSKRAIVYHDIVREGGVPASLARALDIKATVFAPVRSRGRFLAAFALAYPSSIDLIPPDEIALIEGVATQVALAIENARAFDEIARQRLALDVLTSRMIGAQEEERRRIARELHDGVSQTLTAVKFELERVGRKVVGSDDVKRAVATLGAAIGEVRRLCMDLRPSQLDHLGLVATLQWHAKSFSERTGIAAAVDAPETVPPLSPAVEINLYRIIQEALANVARHADATRARIRVRIVAGRRLAVTIADDGRGFDPRTVERGEAGERGMGLLTMSERAHLLGGELMVRSHAGRGTVVEVRVPLRPYTPPVETPLLVLAPDRAGADGDGRE